MKQRPQNMSGSAGPARHAPPSHRRVPAGPRRRRVALYSHDAQGLGHIRRNITLAAALVAAEPETDVLLLTGAPEATTLPLPPGTDVVTLPTLHKDTSGRYSARALSTPLDDLLRLRSSIIEAAVGAFDPDLFIVDKVARGVGGELDAALALLRHAGRTTVVLGLREVLDAPATARREWDAAGTTEAVLSSYDAVWVYGDPDVYDPVAEYRLPASVAAKVAYTGYLGRARGDGAVTRTGLEARVAPPHRPYVLCLVGGGQDGFELADAFVRSDLPRGHEAVVLTGPYMRRDVREALRRAADGRPEVSVLEFVPDAGRFVAGAAAVVSMAGYNSVCELLAAGRRALLVPRVAPRSEQLIRAECLERLGLVDHVRPDRLSPQWIGRWLAGAVLAGPPRGYPVDLDGLRRVPVLAAQLLDVRRLRALGGEPAAPAAPAAAREARGLPGEAGPGPRTLREELADVAV